MRNEWKKEEIDFIKDNYLELSDKEISDILKTHSEASVATKRKRMGLVRSKRKYSFKDVIDEFNKTNYILVSSEEDYVDAATNSLKYICPKHINKGIQKISLGHLKDGRGCYYCGREITESAHMIDLSDDEENKIMCENKGFIYVETIRENGYIYIKYICKKHPEIGIQKMRKGNMKRDNIVGCPYCFDTKKFKFSKGERRISEILDSLNITYIKQYIFENCKDNRCLPFDFYVLDYNLCIEYDGQHHYYPVTFNGVSKEQAIINYKNTLKHDKIKNEYCENNNIKLLRIPFWEFNNIEVIIKEYLNNLE